MIAEVVVSKTEVLLYLLGATALLAVIVYMGYKMLIYLLKIKK